MAIAAQRFKFLDKETNVGTIDFTMLTDNAVYTAVVEAGDSAISLLKEGEDLLNSLESSIEDLLGKISNATNAFMKKIRDALNAAIDKLLSMKLPSFIAKILESLKSLDLSGVKDFFRDLLKVGSAFLCNNLDFLKSFMLGYSLTENILSGLTIGLLLNWLDRYCKGFSKEEVAAANNKTKLSMMFNYDGVTLSSNTVLGKFSNMIADVSKYNETNEKVTQEYTEEEVVTKALNGDTVSITTNLTTSKASSDKKNEYITAIEAEMEKYVTDSNAYTNVTEVKNELENLIVTEPLSNNELITTAINGNIDDITKNLIATSPTTEEKNSYIQIVEIELSKYTVGSVEYEKLLAVKTELENFIVTELLSISDLINKALLGETTEILTNITNARMSIEEKNTYIQTLNTELTKYAVGSVEYEKLLAVKTELENFRPIEQLSISDLINKALLGETTEILTNITNARISIDTRDSYIQTLETELTKLSVDSIEYEKLLAVKLELEKFVINWTLTVNDFIVKSITGELVSIMSNITAIGMSLRKRNRYIQALNIELEKRIEEFEVYSVLLDVKTELENFTVTGVPNKDDFIKTITTGDSSKLLTNLRLLEISSADRKKYIGYIDELLLLYPVGSPEYVMLLKIRGDLLRLPLINEERLEKANNYSSLKDTIGSLALNLKNIDLSQINKHVLSDQEKTLLDKLNEFKQNTLDSIDLQTRTHESGSFSDFDFDSLLPVLTEDEKTYIDKLPGLEETHRYNNLHPTVEVFTESSMPNVAPTKLETVPSSKESNSVPLKTVNDIYITVPKIPGNCHA